MPDEPITSRGAVLTKLNREGETVDKNELENAVATIREYAAATLAIWADDLAVTVGDRLLALAGELPRHDAKLDNAFAAIEAGVVEIKRLKADIANALKQSREVCPDYPWKDSLPNQASQAAWAVTQSLLGTEAANDDLHAIIDKPPGACSTVESGMGIQKPQTRQEEPMDTIHKCPVCDGTGLVSRPPGIAGDQQTWVDSQAAPYPCKACGGTGLIIVEADDAAGGE